MNRDAMETPTHKFRISKVIMGQPYIINQPDNIMIPAQDVRIIVENGAIYARTFLSFGLSEDVVRSAWDHEHDKFNKVNLNQTTA